MSRTLIAYFSRAGENYFGGSLRYIETGNTEIAVNEIRKQIPADVYRIQMENPYPEGYKACVEKARED